MLAQGKHRSSIIGRFGRGTGGGRRKADPPGQSAALDEAEQSAVRASHGLDQRDFRDSFYAILLSVSRSKKCQFVAMSDAEHIRYQIGYLIDQVFLALSAREESFKKEVKSFFIRWQPALPHMMYRHYSHLSKSDKNAKKFQEYTDIFRYISPLYLHLYNPTALRECARTYPFFASFLPAKIAFFLP